MYDLGDGFGDRTEDSLGDWADVTFQPRRALARRAPWRM